MTVPPAPEMESEWVDWVKQVMPKVRHQAELIGASTLEVLLLMNVWQTAQLRALIQRGMSNRPSQPPREPWEGEEE